MFYVAKLYKSSTPLIVEQFEDGKDAFEYAAIMNRSGKGNYIVLRPLDAALQPPIPSKD